jgi:hypothetical protein
MTEPGRGLDTVAPMLGLLTAVALGLSAGAMLAEGAVLVPWWRSLSPQAFLSWYAANASRLFDFFGPLEIAGALLAVISTATYRYQRGGSGRYFAGAAVLALAVLGAFPIYFQPVNASFEARTIELDRVADELARWAWWHRMRTGIGIAAFAVAVAGVRAGGRTDVG